MFDFNKKNKTLLPVFVSFRSRTTHVKEGLSNVRMEGLEPPCLAALDPKSSASTNFATSAYFRHYLFVGFENRNANLELIS